jgi:UDP-N-acetylmuramoyl-tripeptide--D-alanyl-D-alanine ligase
MNPITLSEIAVMSGGTLLAGNPESRILRVGKDSREIRSGDLYVALQGERFDGNAFIAAAAAAGATAALCNGEVPSGLPEGFGIISTADALSSLALLASAWRSRLSLRSIVVTGSSGKTSVKDFTARVLEGSLRVTSTKGNLNNAIGLPLSILEANSDDEAAVWEIGMNHRGEIAPLAGIARPEIAVITGIGSAHIEHLGSLQEIAQEKGDLFARLPSEGYGILPEEDPFAAELRSRTSARVLSVGMVKGDMRATILDASESGTRFRIEGEAGTTEAFVPVAGTHMVLNALLAVTAGWLCGIGLEESAARLEEVELTPGRLQKKLRGGITYLDDTYNANPESMIAALRTMGSIPVKGRRLAVLGRMGELGMHAAEGYRRVGEIAAGNADHLIVVGPEAAAIGDAARAAGLTAIETVPDAQAAAATVNSLAKEGDLVLVKASRSARLEDIFRFLN